VIAPAPKATDPVTRLKGVGPAIAKKLAHLGIERIVDLLLHLPIRYEDRTRVVPIPDLERDQECLTVGRVVGARIAFGKRRSLLATLEDGGRRLTLRFFHFSQSQQKAFVEGAWVRCFGQVRIGPHGLEMVHPEYRLFAEKPAPPEPRLVPVYPATEGVTQQRLRALVQAALPSLGTLPVAEIGTTDLERGAFRSLVDALLVAHDPPVGTTPETLAAAAERIAFDELVAHALVMRARRITRAKETTLPLPRDRQLGRELLKNLGFTLTGAQRRVIKEVLLDLERTTPMLRLVQGDVGSGKTVVAAFAAIRAAEQGYQTAIMAPTEILAEQHYLNFVEWLEPLGIPVALVTGRMSAAQRRLALGNIRTGTSLVVVGTHALFQQQVEFRELALVIVDEQHRFGVHQRLELRAKGTLPHQLVMTATPIPRTLTMALYADMDVSVIDELPPSRQSIDTRLVAESRRDEIVRYTAQACARGRQAYWVCTLIEESDELDARAAETTARELGAALPHLRIGLMHGRLSPEEKGRLMADFKAHRLDLMVATTVIEVGVDVPNATLMVIENSERLGLAQLHQLRGRVGRGAAKSRCVLLYKTPLSEAGKARLLALRETQDGFRIAEEDLKLRGPGDLLGTRQSGEQRFRVADLTAHVHLITRAAALAEELARERPDVAARLVRAWSLTGGGYTSV
jgi:ATP-dependent DNA helicase RecG